MGMRYWSVNCMEGTWPGLWRIWEERQIVTVGWPPGDDWHYDGSRKPKRGWTEVRNKLARMQKGDRIVVRLPGNRIGRIGEIVDMRVRDEDWDPVIEPTENLTGGEQGRQILVRWDLRRGPRDREWACTLPEETRLSRGKLRRAIAELTSAEFHRLGVALDDPRNWAPVAGEFPYERGLRDFIATFPDRLEDGLRPYPAAKVVEHVTRRKGRLDVLLQDEARRPVVVECKRGAPSTDDLDQLSSYARQMQDDLGQTPRGVLVFGGSSNVSERVRDAARDKGIELFAYTLDVGFQRCGL